MSASSMKKIVLYVPNGIQYFLIEKEIYQVITSWLGANQKVGKMILSLDAYVRCGFFPFKTV